MDEITMFAELRPVAPDDADLNQMYTRARRRFTTAVAPRPRWRRPALAAGLTAAVAGGAAAAVVLASGGAAVPAGHAGTVVTSAWTVKLDADGTVTISIRQFQDPTGLQRALRDDGVNAYVEQFGEKIMREDNILIMYPTCRYADTNRAPQAVQQAVVDTATGNLRMQGFTIHPAAMPAGSALFIAGGPVTDRTHAAGIVASTPVVLNSDELPACVPVSIPSRPARPAAGG
jgi:hypothetical protein